VTDLYILNASCSHRPTNGTKVHGRNFRNARTYDGKPFARNIDCLSRRIVLGIASCEWDLRLL